MEYEWWNHLTGTRDGRGSSSQDILMGGGSGEGQVGPDMSIPTTVKNIATEFQ